MSQPNRAYLTFVAVLLLVSAGAVRAEEHEAAGGLSLRIMTPTDDSGASVIPHDKQFWVLVKNESRAPVRLWDPVCRQADSALSFQIRAQHGPSWTMRMTANGPYKWQSLPRTITIEPGEKFCWIIYPSGVSGEQLTWKGVPEPNSGEEFELTATLEIGPDKSVAERGVWTGRVSSPTVKAKVVNPRLKTPQDYLWRRCPKQALRLMQADRSWINKLDGDSPVTPLHHAVRFGMTDVVKWMLAAGADVNAVGYNNFTPLHFANDPEIVRLLVQHKANVDASGAGGTALQEAASFAAYWEGNPELKTERQAKLEVVRALLAAGAEYDAHSAAYLGDTERVERLVRRNPELVHDKELMRIAATNGRAAIVKLLLHEDADPTNADYGGLPVSYFAIEHPDVLKLLFDAGADPRTVINYRGDGRGPEGSTLLHEAAAKGAVGSVELLLQRGLPVDREDAGQRTPLHCAVMAQIGPQHLELVRFLLDHKADPTLKTGDGQTTMFLAASQIRYPGTRQQQEENSLRRQILDLLISRGLPLDPFTAIALGRTDAVKKIVTQSPELVDRKDAEGNSPLARAVQLDQRKIVEVLLAAGADVGARDREGATALHAAAFWGNEAIARLLIENDANVNAADKQGRTPLHESARLHTPAIARLLLRKGAKIDVKDQAGMTPLDDALRPYQSTDGESIAPPFDEMVELLRGHAK
jgi:ankyrin repeat protein